MGTWHHLAASWDGQAMRLYVDGQLEGIRIQGGENTPWSCQAKNVERPNGEALELVLPSAGVVDEIRVSKILRFGPMVPKGAANVPLVVMEKAASASVEVKSGCPHLETSEKDLNATRFKLISKIPDIQAAYVFDANQAKPAWEGMAGMKPLKDFFGQGADGVNLDVLPRERIRWRDSPLQCDLLEADGHQAGQVLYRLVAGDRWFR